VDHGPGGHDDLINSAAGALVLSKVQPVIDAPPAAGPALESYSMYLGGEVALPWDLGAEAPDWG
jgi:hypothetical protein